MEKTIDLLNEVVTMGFTREEALEQIDAVLMIFLVLKIEKNYQQKK